MWLKELTVAIVEKNIDNINKLMDNLPELSDKKELDQAVTLLKEAETLVQSLNDETETSMIQMKKNINFLKSTQEKQTSSFDIKS